MNELHPTVYDPDRVQWSIKFFNVQLQDKAILQTCIDEGWEPFAVTDTEVWFKRRAPLQ